MHTRKTVINIQTKRRSFITAKERSAHPLPSKRYWKEIVVVAYLVRAELGDRSQVGAQRTRFGSFALPGHRKQQHGGPAPGGGGRKDDARSSSFLGRVLEVSRAKLDWRRDVASVCTSDASWTTRTGSDDNNNTARSRRRSERFGACRVVLEQDRRPCSRQDSLRSGPQDIFLLELSGRGIRNAERKETWK